jgi:trehalose 6-phosphate phosphatase
MPSRSLWEHLDDVAELVRRQPFGLISDFDGVLSEIALTPAEAVLYSECGRHLAILQQRLPLVAIVSGRPVDDTRRLVGLDGVVYYGNHGLECWSQGRIALVPEAETYRERISAVIREIGPLMPPGVIIEDKRVGLTLHYRLAADNLTTRNAIVEALERAPAAREMIVSFPKGAVELRPPLGIDKGKVVLALAVEYGLRGCCYLGDDRTDLDAFWAISELARRVDFRGMSIAVAGPETPAEIMETADFVLDGVPEVAKFLGWLVENAAI